MQTPQLISEDYLKELAKDKKNLVYHYEYDKPQFQTTAEDRQRTIDEVRALYEKWREQHELDYNKLDHEAGALLQEAFELKQSKRTDETKLVDINRRIKAIKHELYTLDNDSRRWIRSLGEKYTKFETDHQKTMYTLTSHTTTEEHVKHLRYMAYLQVEQAKGNIDAMTAHAMVQDYLVRKFKTNQTLAQYNKEMEGKK